MGTAHRPRELPNVELWASKPTPMGDGSMRGRLLASVCATGFARATGLTLHPGDLKKLRFTVTLLEPHSIMFPTADSV